MKIGIMGGTFDPIHNGHLMLGKTALEQYELDEVWFMPNGNPPHKKQSSIKSDVKDRVAMTELAIRDNPRFRVELYEAERREISCSWETLGYFSSHYKDDTFYFIIGADSLFAIETWVHPERIFPVCTILAACRDEIDTSEEMECQIKYLKKKYNAKICLLRSPLMNVSSHELRAMIKEGRSITGYVPRSVEEYIKKEELYGAKANKDTV